MGYDVYGLNPKNKSGEYFRANIWSWVPIHELITKTGILDDNTLEEMRHNDCAQVTEEQALQIAQKLKEMLPELINNDGVIYAENPTEPQMGATIIAPLLEILGSNGDEVRFEPEPVHYIQIEHLMEFITFCEHCGGFKVC